MSVPHRGPVRVAAGLAALALAAPGASLAHHPMDGAAPQGVLEGLLSGLAHPLLGLDHALLLVAVALLGAWRRQAAGPVAAWVVAVCAGAVASTTLGEVPGAGWAIGATLVAAAAALARGRALDPRVLAIGAGLAGLVHGHALGETIVGADRSAALSYLAGLAVVQLAVCLALMRAAAAARAPALAALRRVAALACLAGAVAAGALA